MLCTTAYVRRDNSVTLENQASTSTVIIERAQGLVMSLEHREQIMVQRTTDLQDEAGGRDVHWRVEVQPEESAERGASKADEQRRENHASHPPGQPSWRSRRGYGKMFLEGEKETARAELRQESLLVENANEEGRRQGVKRKVQEFPNPISNQKESKEEKWSEYDAKMRGVEGHIGVW